MLSAQSTSTSAPDASGSHARHRSVCPLLPTCTYEGQQVVLRTRQSQRASATIATAAAPAKKDQNSSKGEEPHQSCGVGKTSSHLQDANEELFLRLQEISPAGWGFHFITG